MDTSAVTCASCHTGHQTDMASINNQIFKEGGIFNQCNICHADERHSKENLAHGEVMLYDASGDQANCTKCHVYHWNMPDDTAEQASQPVPACENCHAEASRDYKTSIHGQARAAGIEAAPTCVDCHGETDIMKVEQRFDAEVIVDLCATCHSDRDLMLSFQVNPYVVEGYKDTYHGKLLETGTTDLQFAVCTNCHGSHTIKPPEDPESRVNRARIVETCKQCHPRANDRFVSYLVHPIKPTTEELAAARTDTVVDSTRRAYRDRVTGGEEWLQFNRWVTRFMTLLLIGVLGVFGFHTVLWFQRGIRPRVRVQQKYYRRIDGFHRFLHFLVNVSFLTLAFTGLPQSYAHTDLAKWLFEHVMSIRTAQQLHYIAAIVTAFYFIAHLVVLAVQVKRIGFRKMLTGPNTLMFRWKDIKDFFAHLRWMVGKGPEPRFDRWTYWEKFDYFAVFWGVLVIGLSGLLRWKDEFFGSLLGGGIISLADTIHKEEALLATAFIFIIHFFNTHLRARKFPMDVSIYTGRISEKEFRDERPEEYERLSRAGELEKLEVKPLGVFRTIIAYAWGGLALATGFFLLALIIIGHLTAS
jgi:thiosulfate reductase cytochrome b subunit